VGKNYENNREIPILRLSKKVLKRILHLILICKLLEKNV
jgi:hypothetical protein